MQNSRRAALMINLTIWQILPKLLSYAIYSTPSVDVEALSLQAHEIGLRL